VGKEGIGLIDLMDLISKKCLKPKFQWINHSHLFFIIWMLEIGDFLDQLDQLEILFLLPDPDR
jgi:hypothetical protein